MRTACKVFLPAIMILLPLGFLLFSLTGEMSAGETEKGEVIDVRDGKLDRLRGKDWREILKGSPVSLGDRLRTDQSALAVLEVPKIGRLVMGPDSEMELGRDDKNFKANLPRGAVWLHSKFPKGGGGSISTSLATAGIRGTKFSVFYGRGTRDVCVCTCAGNVEATLKNGKTVQVPGGTILAVLGDAPPPERAEPALPILEKTGAGFDFCFHCHVVGGRGKLKDLRE